MNASDRRVYDELSRINNDLVTMQRRMAGLNADLNAAIEEKNELMGVVSHDLRNPLAVVVMNCSILRDELGANPGGDIEAILDDVENAAKFMKRLVDDLLDFAKVQGANLHLDLQPMDAVALVQRVVGRASRLARAKLTSVVAGEANAPIHMVADQNRLEQVLNNLIGNAITYSPAGSAVRVTVEHREGHVVFSVMDAGPGLTADQIEKLFTPFMPGPHRGTGGEKSTGLGLAIVERLLSAHGGRVSVHSKPGEGATFEAWLPAQGNAL